MNLKDNLMPSPAVKSHRQRARRGIAVLGSMTVVAALGACGSTDATSASGPTGGGGCSSVSYITFGNQFDFQVALVDQVKKTLTEGGIEKVTVNDGKADPTLQTTQVQNALSLQPDVLLLDPVDAKLLTGGVQQANSNDTPVFLLENAPETGTWESFVRFDDEAAGALAADTMAELIGGKGRVLELRGAIGSGQADAREKGFDERMSSKYPDIEVVSLKAEWVEDKALTLILDAFTKNPDVAGIWSHNDTMLRGATGALQQLGKLQPAGTPGHVAMVGLDGTPEALGNIRTGIQDATVLQPADQIGKAAADSIVNFCDGKEVEKSVVVPPELITKENVDDPQLWGNNIK
jgi:ribose transport system substrate-binding protein